MRLLLLNIVFIAVLTACEGRTSTGVGTRNSEFVGEFQGTSTVSVTRADDTRVASSTGSLATFVTAEGTVFVGEKSAVLGAAPLTGDRFVVAREAGGLLGAVPWSCQGEIRLAGRLSFGPGGTAMIAGHWLSEGLVCDGVAMVVTGSLSGTRYKDTAMVSQVLETDHQALIAAIRDVLGPAR